jgi:hypothetical protein
MKIGFALLLAGLVTAAGLSAPAPARADDSHDCSDGCYIITCNENVCSTWRCDDRGCRLLNTFYRDFAVLQSGRAGGKARPAGPDVAHAKVCPAGQPCDLYELTATGATHLGRFDNVDDVLQQRRALRR